MVNREYMAGNFTRKFVFLVSFLGVLLTSGCQRSLLPENLKVQYKIPFEYHNRFIVVTVLMDNALPLKFIFDTGAENTILTQRYISDVLGYTYEREFRLIGSDMRTELVAYLIRGTDLKIGSMHLSKQPLLVLEDDYFRFEEYSGTTIHGIMGASMFKNFTVQIDYQQRMITLVPLPFAPTEYDIEPIPIEINKNKPYLHTRVTTAPGVTVPAKFLIDTGAGLATLLHINTHPDLQLPEASVPGNIGAGLGGYLEGYMGTIQHLDMGPFQLNRIPAGFQIFRADMDTSYLNGRNGVIGNQILERFTVVLDYPREKFYLLPNDQYDQTFEVNRSGLVLAATGPQLRQILIQQVIPGSPAEAAGLQAGDRLQRINLFPSGEGALSAFQNMLSAPAGREVTVVVKRDQERIKARLKLADYWE